MYSNDSGATANTELTKSWYRRWANHSTVLSLVQYKILCGPRCVQWSFNHCLSVIQRVTVEIPTHRLQTVWFPCGFMITLWILKRPRDEKMTLKWTRKRWPQTSQDHAKRRAGANADMASEWPFWENKKRHGCRPLPLQKGSIPPNYSSTPTKGFPAKIPLSLYPFTHTRTTVIRIRVRVCVTYHSRLFFYYRIRARVYAFNVKLYGKTRLKRDHHLQKTI